MTYSKQTWANDAIGGTPIDKDRLNHMEDGIGNAALATDLATTNTAVGNKLDAAGMHAATSKTTPVDADELAIVDSAASNGLKKLTFGNLAAWIMARITVAQLAAPASALAMNGQRITGLSDPSGSQDAATKAYVDANGGGGGVVSLTYANAAPGTRFTLLYNGSTGFVDQVTGSVATSRPSARSNIFFDLLGGSVSVTDPSWMINGDGRDITS